MANSAQVKSSPDTSCSSRRVCAAVIVTHLFSHHFRSTMRLLRCILRFGQMGAYCVHGAMMHLNDCVQRLPPFAPILCFARLFRVGSRTRSMWCQNFPQGLKALSILAPFTAQLMPCPDTELFLKHDLARPAFRQGAGCQEVTNACNCSSPHNWRTARLQSIFRSTAESSQREERDARKPDGAPESTRNGISGHCGLRGHGDPADCECRSLETELHSAGVAGTGEEPDFARAYGAAGRADAVRGGMRDPRQSLPAVVRALPSPDCRSRRCDTNCVDFARAPLRGKTGDTGRDRCRFDWGFGSDQGGARG